MKKMGLVILCSSLLLIGFSALLCITVHATDDMKKIHMTCYTHTGNSTASGVMPYDGGCAYQSKYIGYKAVVYENDNGMPGALIGVYDINDTGYGAATKEINPDTGKPYGTIQLGWSIDIFKESIADCKDFIKDHGDTCYIRLMKVEEE